MQGTLLQQQRAGGVAVRARARAPLRPSAQRPIARPAGLLMRMRVAEVAVAPPAPAPAVADADEAAEPAAAPEAAAAPARPVEQADPSAPRDEILAEARATAKRHAPATAAALAALTPSQSYSEHYDLLFGAGRDALPIKTPTPKPSRGAQLATPGARPIALSDVGVTPKVPLFTGRSWNATDGVYVAVMVAVHGLALLAPFTFSWGNVALFLGTYFLTGCLGITLSFHRQLSHRSFQTPKWLEYALAYCGVLAVQGDPIEWVSSHRYHHLHTDTPLDPHSPYEGFWWSHMGWLLDNRVTTERVHDRANAKDLEDQPFYRWVRDTYAWHVAAQAAVLFALGGLPALVWGGALRLVWVYHITWFVNSAAHCWGSQSYDTGDLSRNNWWVAAVAFGEGWHNNHHAFEFSARHGLEWWQFDVTWGVVRFLQVLGLAKNVKLPSEKQKERLRLPVGAVTAA